MKQQKHIKVYHSILQLEGLNLNEKMILSTIISFAVTNDNSTSITNESLMKVLNGDIKKSKMNDTITKLTRLGFITRTTTKLVYEDSAKWRNKRFITLTEKTLALLQPEETKIQAVTKPKPIVAPTVQPVVKPSEIKAEATPVAPEPQEETINTKDALHFLYNDYDYEKLQNLFCSRWNPMIPSQITRTKLIDLLNNRHFWDLKAALGYPLEYASEYKEITKKLLDWDGTIPEPKEEPVVEPEKPEVKIIKLESKPAPEPEVAPRQLTQAEENEIWYQELMAMD